MTATLEPVQAAETDRLKAEVEALRQRNERLETQLAAVSMAVHGGLTGEKSLQPGAYAYTTTLNDAVRLRSAFERLRLMVSDCEDIQVA